MGKVHVVDMVIYSNGSGHQSSSLGFPHLSLEHNGKSNIIIGTLSHKRQMCGLLLTLCFPQCFMCSLRRCSGLLQTGNKFQTFFFFYRKGRLLSGWRLTMARSWIETYMTGPTEDRMDSSVWWIAFLRLNHRAHPPSKTPTKESVPALGQCSQFARGDTDF